MNMSVQDWVALISVVVAALALGDTFFSRSQSNAREDGKTAEILREVNEKLKDITDQQTINNTQMQEVIQRLALVEKSDADAHRSIGELWKQIRQ
mgnify:CR=1 FL=1